MRMKVQEVAKLMQCSPQMVRLGLQRGELPFGYAVKMSGRYTYHISKHKVYEYLGKELVNG